MLKLLHYLSYLVGPFENTRIGKEYIFERNDSMIIENGTWTVYAHINKENGKIYIGVTSMTPPQKRWGSNGINYRGCQKFYYAIQKYGWDGFDHEIIASHLTKEEACNMEKLLISKLNTIEDGYNLEPGGVDQGPRSPEAIQKLREARLRQVITPEQFEKGAAKRRGVKHSEERRAKVKEAVRRVCGRPVVCIETGIRYESAAEAAEKTGKLSSNIRASADRYEQGIKSRNRGLHWKYATKKPNDYPEKE